MTWPHGVVRQAGPSLRWRMVGAVLPLVLLAAWAGTLLISSRPPRPDAQIGQPAPDFALTDLDGNPLQLSGPARSPGDRQLLGQLVRAVRRRVPAPAERGHAAHQADDLAVVGIVFRDNSEAARDFMARMGASWPAAMDPGELTAESFGIFAPPETFFIDADGVVRGRQIGQLTATDLERQLALTLTPGRGVADDREPSGAAGARGAGGRHRPRHASPTTTTRSTRTSSRTSASRSLPLALIALLVLTFVLAAWTFLAAQPPA